MVRIVRTMLAGWKRHKNHPDLRVRRRFAFDARELPTELLGLGCRRATYYRGNPGLRAKMDAILHELHAEFGLKSRFCAALGGPYILEDPPRRKAARRRLDLRTADLLRAK